MYFSKFRKEVIRRNETTNASKDLVFSHLAVFEKSIRVGDDDYDFDYVASCVTFLSQERLPPGEKYHVKIITIQ